MKIIAKIQGGVRANGLEFQKMLAKQMALQKN
jgi:hypothetical protein